MQRRHTWIGLLVIAAAWLSQGLAEGADRMHMIVVQGVTVLGADKDGMKAAMLYQDWKKVTQTNGRLVYVMQDTKQGNRAKILGAIDQLGEIGERDVVVFYYTGHGAIREDVGHILQLDDREEVTRDELRQKLRGAGARLTVMITDCCSIVIPPRPIQSKGLDAPEIAQRVVGNLTRLFAVNGLVDINSSSRGEAAWGIKSGGLFTTELKRILSEERVDDWKGFTGTLEEATKNSYAEFQKRNVDQGGRPDGLEDADLETVQKQASQTPQVYALDIKGDDAVENPVPPPPARGVVVTKVFEGTTAMELFLNGQQMRLEAGDRITAINGKAIQNAEHFGEVIDSLGRGAAVTISVVDTNTGDTIQLRGSLDSGGDYRFGAQVTDR